MIRTAQRDLASARQVRLNPNPNPDPNPNPHPNPNPNPNPPDPNQVELAHVEREQKQKRAIAMLTMRGCVRCFVAWLGLVNEMRAARQRAMAHFTGKP